MIETVREGKEDHSNKVKKGREGDYGRRMGWEGKGVIEL